MFNPLVASMAFTLIESGTTTKPAKKPVNNTKCCWFDPAIGYPFESKMNYYLPYYWIAANTKCDKYYIDCPDHILHPEQ